MDYHALKKPRARIQALMCFVVAFVAVVFLGWSAYYRLWASPSTADSIPTWDYKFTPRPMGPSLLFPASLDPPADDHSWHAHNARATAALFRCLERADCAANQTKGA
jgi:hypothetical protein